MKTLLSLLMVTAVMAIVSGCAHPAGAPASRPDSFQESGPTPLWQKQL